MSETKLGLAAWEALPEEKKQKLRLLGGGPREEAGTPVVAPERAPKRYPPLAGGTSCWRTHFEVRAPETEEWPEPLCRACYEQACARPPRAVLTFDDGHREMRNNFIATTIYRDVEQSGEEPVLTWHEFVREQRENGKLVMQFYRQIPRPVDALGRALPTSPAARLDALADIAAIMRRKPSRWARLVRWLRVAWAPKGMP